MSLKCIVQILNGDFNSLLFYIKLMKHQLTEKEENLCFGWVEHEKDL